MRFRATVDNIPTFYKIVQAIEKLQKRCIVRFTETDMHIICLSDANDGGMQVWSQIRVQSLFVEYRIQSNAGNQITLTLSSEALLAALRSASGHGSSNSNAALSNVELIMKLAKKSDQAVLSFEMNAQSRSGGRVHVTHDVRIEVMKPQDVEGLTEPLCPEPDVHILLPPLAKLRTIAERLRAHSDIIGLRANRDGLLVLSVSTDHVKTDVTWTGLSNPTMTRDRGAAIHGFIPEGQSQDINEDHDPSPSQIPAAPVDKKRVYGVLVSVKSFLKFLNSYLVSTTTIACLCQNHCIIMYVYIGEIADAGGVLTFYLPAVVEDEP